MDSGNSGSVQSSDDEFDSSRGEPISNFFNSSPNFGSTSSPSPQFVTRQNPNFFDDNPIWSGGLRNFPNFMISNPSQSSQLSPFPIQPPPATGPDGGDRSKPSSDHHLSTVTKNPKKRTRASRRAPTTVLTTDTTNFRQMVQEFTGIPSSPFAGGASPYSRRMDLFSAPAALRLGGGGGGHLDTLGPLYSLRPQFPPPPPSVNSTMIDSMVPSTNIINPNSAVSDHLLTLQNPMTGFGGFPIQKTENHPSSTAATASNQNHNDGKEENLTWKSGETVMRNDESGFDGNIDRSMRRRNDDGEEDDEEISGHNLLQVQNVNLAGKDSSSASGVRGTVASWIFPSQ